MGDLAGPGAGILASVTLHLQGPPRAPAPVQGSGLHELLAQCLIEPEGLLQQQGQITGLIVTTQLLPLKRADEGSQVSGPEPRIRGRQDRGRVIGKGSRELLITQQVIAESLQRPKARLLQQGTPVALPMVVDGACRGTIHWGSIATQVKRARGNDGRIEGKRHGGFMPETAHC